MSVTFVIAALFAMFAVVGVLVLGVVSMIRGGDLNKKYGNRLMQARVGLQALALLLIALAYFVSPS